MGPFRALRFRDFRSLWLGGLVSKAGDMVLVIALPFHVYNLTGSTMETGATFLLSTLPRLLLGSVAGVFADRWDRKWTMIAVDLSRALVLLPLLLVHSQELVWVVYVVAFVKGVLGQFFGPAYNSILPRLVDKEALVACNSLNSISDSSVRLVGPTLGGALLALSGISLVVVLDVVSYLASALFIGLIRWRPEPAEEPAPPEVEVHPVRGVLDSWLEGLRVLIGNPLLTRLLVVAAVAMAAQGVISVLLVPFVKDLLGGSALEFGWLATAQGVGGLAGGLLIGHVGQRAANLGLIGVSLCMVGGLFFLMVQFASLPVALVLITLVGVPSSAFYIGIQSLFHLHTTDEHRGRIFGTYGSVVVLMSMVGMGVASISGELVSLTVSLSCAGLAFILAGVLSWSFAAGLPVSESEAVGQEPG